MAILGIITLAAGYALAIFTKDAVDAVLLFFIAVILVIIGTYFLFTAGSIALLKVLKKKKKYYYKPNHFTMRFRYDISNETKLGRAGKYMYTRHNAACYNIGDDLFYVRQK